MEYLPVDDYDYDTPPDVIYHYEVIIHVIFMDPLSFDLDSMDLYNLMKDFKDGKILPIGKMIINSRHIKLIEIHRKENRDGFN